MKLGVNGVGRLYIATNARSRDMLVEKSDFLKIRSSCVPTFGGRLGYRDLKSLLNSNRAAKIRTTQPALGDRIQLRLRVIQGRIAGWTQLLLVGHACRIHAAPVRAIYETGAQPLRAALDWYQNIFFR